jgi:hypothetical protein
MANAPLLGTGRQPKATDLPLKKSRKYFAEGLDRFLEGEVICPSGCSSSPSAAVRRKFRAAEPSKG